jgi:hemerythrin
MTMQVSRLEGEHARIAGMLQRATKAFMRHASPSEVNAILLELGGYALNHFREEEALMATSGYPGAEAHRREHEGMASYVRGLLDLQSKQDALLGAVNVLDQWIEAHIRIMDKEFFDFLQTARH